MSISGLKRGARERIFKNAPKLFLVALIYVAVTTLLPLLSNEVSGSNSVLRYFQDEMSHGRIPYWQDAADFVRPFGSLLSLVIALFIPVINIGFSSYSLKISRDINGDYRDLLDGFTMLGKVIALFIMIGIFTALWTLLLIFPGIIASYRYSQAYFILLDNPEKGVLQCIRESKELMRGNKLDLFILDLSFIGWSILAAILIFAVPLPFVSNIIYVWIQPYVTITKANFYNYLIRYNPETVV